MSDVHGLVLDEDDLAAARRCAHEALVLVVGEIATDDEIPGIESDAVIAHARLLHALGTETDPRAPLLLVSTRDADLLLEGARRVEEDLREGLGQHGGDHDDRHRRYEGTIAAARRVQEITGLRAA